MLWKTRENTSESRKSTPSKEKIIRLDPRPCVAKVSETNAAPASHRCRIVRGSLVLPCRC